MRRSRTGWLAAVLLIGLSATASAGAELRPVYKIVIDGSINPAVADFVRSSIDEAEEDGAAALVIALDTPGGLLNSTKTIVKDMLASPVPVIVYITPGGASATSAGVFITLAGHIAAMAPGTSIGAAHPVGGQGENIEGDMREKVENYAVSFVESIAERRGRNVEWAAKAVRESVSITESEAVEREVVDLVAANLDELIQKSDGREIELLGTRRKLDLSSSLDAAGHAFVKTVDMTFRQRVLNRITDPNIAYLLMMAGMLGLYMEFSNPGAILPGVAGAICLLLALLASQVLPISSTGILLILVGMAFLLGELMMPSFGVLGVGGLVAITLGSLFLYTPESQIHVDPAIVTTTVGLFGVAVAAILLLLVRDRRKQAKTGAEGLVGELGTAVTFVHQTGKVRVHGELWNAASDRPIESGRSIRIVSVQGMLARVCEEEDR